MITTLVACVCLNFVVQRSDDYWTKCAAMCASCLVAGEAIGDALERVQRLRRRRAKERDSK